jgi:hypothetical protein
MHELPHNHSENPRHAHPLPCVRPYRNTCNNFKPFLDIFNTAEVFSSGFFSFNLPDQVLLLPIYNTPKSKSNHIFLVLYYLCWSFNFPFITPQPLAFTSSTCFKIFLLISSLCLPKIPLPISFQKFDPQIS